MSRRIAALALASLAPALAACSPDTGVEPSALSVDCPAVEDLTRAATCWTVAVPIDHGRPDGATYDLMVMRLAADAETPEADPVLFVPGGPGESAIPEAAALAEHPITATRDLVLVDPRGAGWSEPSLACPELDDARLAYFTTAERSFTDALDTTRSAVGACAQRLSDDGIALQEFSTVTLAADLDLVRQALDIEQWNLWSVSYGTRVAQESMRSFPDSLRAVVLDSLAPIDELELVPENLTRKVDGSLAALVDACASDDACASTYPSLAADIDTMVQRYDDAPHRTIIGDVEVAFTGRDFVFVVWNMLKGADTIPLAPNLVTSLAAGDTSLLDEFIAPALTGLVAPDPLTFSDGLNFTVDCRDYGALLPAADVADVADPGRTSTFVVFNTGSSCGALGVEPGPADFATPLSSDVPALVLAGGLDPATPPTTARSAAERLSRGTVVNFPAAGHDLNGTSECAQGITAQWLDTLASPDITCIPASVEW
jgi:pimeloyl-ACP methyl ester carboxylesterase